MIELHHASNKNLTYCGSMIKIIKIMNFFVNTKYFRIDLNDFLFFQINQN